MMNTNNNQTENKETSKQSNEQKQKLKKYAVFALMGIIFAACIWFIFAPSADERAKSEEQTGFNADIPMPTNESIIGDKASAYEQEQMKQNQAERMRSLDNFNAFLGETAQQQSDDLLLLPDEPSVVKAGGNTYPQKNSAIQNSMNAYQDINRTLGNFYETPREDPEKERLKLELEALKTRMDETDNRKKTVDDQITLMEKSFQMAAKYLPSAGTTAGNIGTASTDGATGQSTSKTATNSSGKTSVASVAQFKEQTVSALPQEMSGKEVMLAFSKPRNMGFFTVTAEGSKERKNTLSACIHADQTVMDGESVRLRLLEAVQAGQTVIPENTVLSGFAKIQGDRLQITVGSLEYNGTVIAVEIAVYDTDGQRGIFIPDINAVNAAKEIVANMGTNAGTSVNLSNDAGKQFLADMGRNVIQGVSQFTAKKLREVKVNLKAGYRILLLPEGSNKN